ncbi:MAG: 4-(cytidine 5'-diphospho)-2-C-methyl-D-erythritol kinase [Proteobacteria bacterium]|nr:MAG: 4-(cytidine 5'-diphospho)-2-C-methyl-D-erythritol kinase [Pseudomonadota bacterium]
MTAVSNDAPGEPLGTPAPWPAPAKLNLCLHIVGRRADGYHLLQTAMQFIDLADELAFFQRPAGVIERLGGPEHVAAEADLTIRAARLLAAQVRATRGELPGVAIRTTKRIPLQAGLGGGSSDAATVLVALNRLWDAGLDVEALAALGLKLGADVPLFVRGRAAWAEGVGEILTPCNFPEPWYVVVKPVAAVSTAEIFQAPELTRNSPVTTIRDFLAAGGRNDCVRTVCGRYPEIAEALDWLGKFGEAKLTGTGACVFVAVPDRPAAEAVVGQVPWPWRGFAARGRNGSPLMERLAAEP